MHTMQVIHFCPPQTNPAFSVVLSHVSGETVEGIANGRLILHYISGMTELIHTTISHCEVCLHVHMGTILCLIFGAVLELVLEYARFGYSDCIRRRVCVQCPDCSWYRQTAFFNGRRARQLLAVASCWVVCLSPETHMCSTRTWVHWRNPWDQWDAEVDHDKSRAKYSQFGHQQNRKVASFFRASFQGELLARQVRGDGNCMWRAVSMQLGVKWYSLKRRTLSDRNISRCDDIGIAEVKQLRKRNAWGNSTALQLLANLLCTDIYVCHAGGVGVFFGPSGSKGSRPIFLALSSQRFEAISPHDGVRFVRQADASAPIGIGAFERDGFREMLCHSFTFKTRRTGYWKYTRVQQQCLQRWKDCVQGPPLRNISDGIEIETQKTRKHDTARRGNPKPSRGDRTPTKWNALLSCTLPLFYLALISFLHLLGDSSTGVAALDFEGGFCARNWLHTPYSKTLDGCEAHKATVCTASWRYLSGMCWKTLRYTAGSGGFSAEASSF